MEDLHTLAAALATLGYAPNSSASFAARAAHHSAELLYEAAQGDLLVTLLVGRRSTQTSIVLYLCDSVQQSLSAGDWSTVGTGVNWLFMTFRGSLRPIDARSQRPTTPRDGVNVSSAGPAGSSYALGGSVAGSGGGAPGSGGGAAGQGRGAVGSEGGAVRSNGAEMSHLRGGTPPLHCAPPGPDDGGGAAGSGSVDAAAGSDHAGGPVGGEAPSLPPRPPPRASLPSRVSREPQLRRHALPEMPTMLSLPKMVGNSEPSNQARTEDGTGAGNATSAGDATDAVDATVTANMTGAASATGEAAATGEADATGAVNATGAVSKAREVNIPDNLCASILPGLRRHYSTDQLAIRSWLKLLKQCTLTLLQRLPPSMLVSKRAPQYKAMTPAAVANVEIKYNDGGVLRSALRPVITNTASTNVTPIIAIILYMANEGDPFYLWMIDQFKSGVIVESTRKRKAPASSTSAGHADDNQPPRRQRTTPSGTGTPHAGEGALNGSQGVHQSRGGGRSSGSAGNGGGGSNADGSRSAGALTTPVGSDAEEAGGAALEEAAVGSLIQNRPNEYQSHGHLPASALAGLSGASLARANATAATDEAAIERRDAVAASLASVNSVLSHADKSTSTGSCVLYNADGAAIAAACCDPSVEIHCGSPVPVGLVSMSQVLVIREQSDCVYPHGGHGTCEVSRPLAGSPTLLSVRSHPLLWDLSQLGYVRGLSWSACAMRFGARTSSLSSHLTASLSNFFPPLFPRAQTSRFNVGQAISHARRRLPWLCSRVAESRAVRDRQGPPRRHAHGGTALQVAL